MKAENQDDDTPVKRERVQFSIRHLLLAFLSLSVLLALATQFKHVGFVAFCFLAATVVGWWLRKWRLMFAGLTALCVFIISYVACWTQIGHATFIERPAIPGMFHRLLGKPVSGSLRPERTDSAFVPERSDLYPILDSDHPLDYAKVGTPAT